MKKNYPIISVDPKKKELICSPLNFVHPRNENAKYSGVGFISGVYRLRFNKPPKICIGLAEYLEAGYCHRNVEFILKPVNPDQPV
jgi:hypothetical protein